MRGRGREGREEGIEREEERGREETEEVRGGMKQCLQKRDKITLSLLFFCGRGEAVGWVEGTFSITLVDDSPEESSSILISPLRCSFIRSSISCLVPNTCIYKRRTNYY